MRCILLLLMLCLCMPAAAEGPKRITYAEPWGTSFPLWMERTDGEHAVFLFDVAVDDASRRDCMKAVEELLQRLPAVEKPEICVATRPLFGGAVIEGNRLYLSPMDWQSADFAAMVLEAAAGEYSHCGLAYGLAGWLQGKTGGFAPMREPAAYDLNLLCFDDEFVPAEDAHNARTLSICFAAEYIGTHGMAAYLSLLLESDTQEGMQAAADALRDFYAGHGMQAEVSVLRYARGGQNYQYKVLADGAEFYVGRDWQDAHYTLNPLVTEHFLHEDYASVREFFLINETQMAQYRQLFSAAGPWKDVTVLLLNPQQKVNTSCYQTVEHCILLLNVDSLMHEYIHALLRPRSTQQLWETEGIARYFSFYYDHYGWAFLNEDYNHLPDEAYAQYVHDYLAAVGRPIDMAVDFGELESLGACSCGALSPNENYASASAFVHYLVQRFGEEAVIRHVCGLEALPEDVFVLREDWTEWLNEHYQHYTANE